MSSAAELRVGDYVAVKPAHAEGSELMIEWVSLTAEDAEAYLYRAYPALAARRSCGACSVGLPSAADMAPMIWCVDPAGYPKSIPVSVFEAGGGDSSGQPYTVTLARKGGGWIDC